MNTTLECERTLLVQADFDGELDAAQAAGLIPHEAECAHCQSVRAQLVRSREVLRTAPRYAASQELRALIARKSGAEAESGSGRPVVAQTAAGEAAQRPASVAPTKAQRRFARTRAFGWGAALAASCVLATVLLWPRTPGVAEQLVSNHLRAMQLDSHLIDVASSDHHTVKPWFAGKVNFAPLVKEIDSDGYVLKGGRIDIVRGEAAAVLVYQAGKHLVDVYMWPDQSGSGAGLIDSLRSTPVNGFQTRHWQEGGLVVWCVSDLGSQELDHFTERWRAR